MNRASYITDTQQANEDTLKQKRSKIVETYSYNGISISLEPTTHGYIAWITDYPEVKGKGATKSMAIGSVFMRVSTFS